MATPAEPTQDWREALEGVAKSARKGDVGGWEVDLVRRRVEAAEQSSKAEVEQLTEARDFYAGLYADRCGLLLERDTRIASLEARVAELEAGLSKCREVFAEYAEMHRRKLGSERPLDSFEHQAIIRKVERNRDMADLCIAALAATEQGEVG